MAEQHHTELAFMLWNVTSGKARVRTDRCVANGGPGMQEALSGDLFLLLCTGSRGISVAALSCVIPLVENAGLEDLCADIPL